MTQAFGNITKAQPPYFTSYILWGAYKHKYHVQLKHIFIQHTKTTSNLNEQYNIVM